MEHTLTEEAGVKIVRLRGPMDVSRAMELRDLLGRLIDGPSARVLVDLAEVTLIDSSGVGLFVTAHRTADSVGARFGLAAAGGSVGRVFELTRTDRLLRIFPSVAEGVGALSGDAG